MIQVGVVGPHDLVQRVLALTAEFPMLQLVEAPYQDESEAPALAAGLEHRTDAILFTGPVPYHLTQEALSGPDIRLYVPYTGAGLLKSLFQLSYHSGLDIRRASVDTLDRRIVEEVYAELHLPTDGLLSKAYTGAVPSAELVAFHEEAWQSGRSAVALTCVSSAYRTLLQEGVPVGRITPASASIRSALRLAQSEVEARRARAKELVVALLRPDLLDVQDVNGSEGQSQKDSLPTVGSARAAESRVGYQTNGAYRRQRLRLELHQLALQFAERIQGAAWGGEDDIVLFATRGAFESGTDGYSDLFLVERISQQLGITASLGVGYGATVSEAEANARMALALARKEGGNCCFVVRDGQEVLGPLGRPAPLEYAIRMHEDRFRSAAQVTGLGPTTLSRVDALLKVRGRRQVTANELAAGLGCRLRTARRLLAAMQRVKLARVIGQEQPPGRGRPRQVFAVEL